MPQQTKVHELAIPLCQSVMPRELHERLAAAAGGRIVGEDIFDVG